MKRAAVVSREREWAIGGGSGRTLIIERWRSAVNRPDADVVVRSREDDSLCQSVKAVWEWEKRFDARSARPFLTNPLPLPPLLTGLKSMPPLTSFSFGVSSMKLTSGSFPCRKKASTDAEPACDVGSVARAMCVVDIVRRWDCGVPVIESDGWGGNGKVFNTSCGL